MFLFFSFFALTWFDYGNPLTGRKQFGWFTDQPYFLFVLCFSRCMAGLIIVMPILKACSSFSFFVLPRVLISQAVFFFPLSASSSLFVPFFFFFRHDKCLALCVLGDIFIWLKALTIGQSIQPPCLIGCIINSKEKESWWSCERWLQKAIILKIQNWPEQLWFCRSTAIPYCENKSFQEACLTVGFFQTLQKFFHGSFLFIVYCLSYLLLYCIFFQPSVSHLSLYPVFPFTF